MRILGVILQNFPGGMPPDPPRMIVPLALPLKLICDITRLWRNFAPISEIYCVRHWIHWIFTVRKGQQDYHYIYDRLTVTQQPCISAELIFIWWLLIFSKKITNYCKNARALKGTRRLSSQCPSTVKSALFLSSFNSSWCCIYVGKSC